MNFSRFQNDEPSDAVESAENIELTAPDSHGEHGPNEEHEYNEKRVSGFKDISEALRIFDLEDIKQELEKPDEILLLNLEIDGVFENLRQSELQKLSKKCRNKSIVVLFASKNQEKFSVYWKSKELQNFLIFLPNKDTAAVNDKNFYDFLAKFLAESLSSGHLGLCSAISKSVEKDGNIELHFFADQRDFNLLLLAAETGKTDVLRILLEQNLETELCKQNKEVTAQDLAWKGHHHEVVLTLLKSGETYPKSFDISESSTELKEFCETSEELHTAVIDGNETRINEILNKSEGQHPFYNHLNESAPTIALDSKQIDIYKLLTTRKVFLGRHEVLHDFWGKFDEFERDQLRKIHFKNSVHMPEKHLNDLINCSSVSHDDKNVKSNLNLAQYAFGILNQNPFIRIILMIVAASKRMKIIFDFKSTSVDAVDPSAGSGMRGMFYTEGIICVAAGFLINQSVENETFGTLAHELCHYAMNLVYRNSARPYRSKDRERRREFAKIASICEKNRAKEKLIDLAFNYRRSMHHAELIVRVPHLMALYHNQPEKLKEARENFTKLFDYYEQKVVPDMERALPKIEKEIERMEGKILKNQIISIVTVVLSIILIIAGIYVTFLISHKPIYKFNNLSNGDQVKVRDAPVIYKNVQVRFQDLFPQNSSIYQNLTSDHISMMLDGHPLNFSDPHAHYLDDQVRHNWGNLAGQLKQKILTSNFTFQNESLKFQKLYEKSPKAFKFLTSEQIVEVLNGQELIVNQMIPNRTNFYVERNFLTENIVEIFLAYEKQIFSENKLDDESYDTRAIGKLRESEDNFKDFYDRFLSEDANTYVRKLNESKKRVTGRENRNKNLERFNSFQTFQKDFEDILKKVEKSKIFILSSEAGTGKTLTFEQFTIRIKRKFPTRWVSYIDLKDFTRFYNKNESLGNVLRLLEDILGLSTKNEFEMKIFEELFEAGNLVLLWNGFDEISPTYSDFVLNLLSTIHKTTNNTQFLCTRPLYSDHLLVALNDIPHAFVEFDDFKQDEFLRKFFISAKVDENKISTYVLKVYDIVNVLSEKVGSGTEDRGDFNTPLMLKMIGELIANETEINESENLWQIYEKFIRRKIDLWEEKSEIARFFLKQSMADPRNFNMIRLYQMYALRSELSYNNQNSYYKTAIIEKLRIMRRKIPKELTGDEISRMGILYINGENEFKFAHKTFAEFFIAQFLIESIYYADNFDPEDAVLIIQLFLDVTEKYGREQIVVTKFLISFLQTQDANLEENFDPKIAEIFRTKFNNFSFAVLQKVDSKIFKFLFDFFKKDHKLLTDLLRVNESETFYTGAFNYAYFVVYFVEMNQKNIKKLGCNYLSREEFPKFINGRNQKGIILFSSYLFYRYDATWTRPRTVIHDTYDLDKTVLENSEKLEVLALIAKNLTESERDELFLSTSSPLTWKEYDLIKNETFWDIIDISLTHQAKITLFSNLFRRASKLQNWKLLPVLLENAENHLSKFEIFEIFRARNILHLSAAFQDDLGKFEKISEFFVNHTSVAQQKEVLLREIDGECFVQYKLATPHQKCYHFPPLNIFHILLIFSSDDKYKMRETNFTATEMQEIVLKSNNFLPYFIHKQGLENCKKFTNYLKILFTGNEEVLRNFLLRKIPVYNLDIFELPRHASYSVNIKPFLDLMANLNGTSLHTSDGGLKEANHGSEAQNYGVPKFIETTTVRQKYYNVLEMMGIKNKPKKP